MCWFFLLSWCYFDTFYTWCHWFSHTYITRSTILHTCKIYKNQSWLLLFKLAYLFATLGVFYLRNTETESFLFRDAYISTFVQIIIIIRMLYEILNILARYESSYMNVSFLIICCVCFSLFHLVSSLFAYNICPILLFISQLFIVYKYIPKFGIVIILFFFLCSFIHSFIHWSVHLFWMKSF